MVYADWLEQRGDEAKAAWLRAEWLRWHGGGPRAVRRHLDPAWLVPLARATPKEIGRRVSLLAARDPERRRYGASQHGYAFRPTNPNHRGIALPTQYAIFLTHLGDGGCGPGHGGIYPFASARLANLVQPFPAPATVDELDRLDGRPGMLLVADGFWLVVNGRDYGHVWGSHSEWFGPMLGNGGQLWLPTAALLATPASHRLEFLDWYQVWIDDALDDPNA